ncbi:hypothetical protein ABEF92_003059 [Exophiala dermatitidis]
MRKESSSDSHRDNHLHSHCQTVCALSGKLGEAAAILEGLPAHSRSQDFSDLVHLPIPTILFHPFVIQQHYHLLPVTLSSFIRGSVRVIVEVDAMTVATMVIMLLLLALSSAAPTKVVLDKTTSPSAFARVFFEQLCEAQFCLFGKGKVTFNSGTYSCDCPDWNEHPMFTSPCADLSCPVDQEPFYSYIDDACYCKSFDEWYKVQEELADAYTAPDMERVVDLRRRQITPTGPATTVDTAVPTFIPPPSQDVTPALLNESLTVQPQNTATIGSIVPWFADNLLQVHMQLNGPVADTLVVNASASFPCGNVGFDPEPSIALVPKVVYPGQGEPQVIIADCQCIAVNMYTPTVITYWIQKLDGTVYSLSGSNKVMDLNKMNTNQSVALTLVALSSGPSKRDAEGLSHYVQPERRQMFRGECDQPCPFYHMRKVTSGDGFCACMFNGADEELTVTARDMAEPDSFTAKMTPEACAAMTCFEGGDHPAVFNPFSLTCWCVTPPYLENNPSAWTPSA